MTSTKNFRELALTLTKNLNLSFHYFDPDLNKVLDQRQIFDPGQPTPNFRPTLNFEPTPNHSKF